MRRIYRLPVSRGVSFEDVVQEWDEVVLSAPESRAPVVIPDQRETRREEREREKELRQRMKRASQSVRPVSLLREERRIHGQEAPVRRRHVTDREGEAQVVTVDDGNVDRRKTESRLARRAKDKSVSEVRKRVRENVESANGVHLAHGEETRLKNSRTSTIERLALRRVRSEKGARAIGRRWRQQRDGVEKLLNKRFSYSKLSKARDTPKHEEIVRIRKAAASVISIVLSRAGFSPRQPSQIVDQALSKRYGSKWLDFLAHHPRDYLVKQLNAWFKGYSLLDGSTMNTRAIRDDVNYSMQREFTSSYFFGMYFNPDAPSDSLDWMYNGFQREYDLAHNLVSNEARLMREARKISKEEASKKLREINHAKSQITALRLLLLIAGIEPNPGPSDTTTTCSTTGSSAPQHEMTNVVTHTSVVPPAAPAASSSSGSQQANPPAKKKLNIQRAGGQAPSASAGSSTPASSSAGTSPQGGAAQGSTALQTTPVQKSEVAGATDQKSSQPVKAADQNLAGSGTRDSKDAASAKSKPQQGSLQNSRAQKKNRKTGGGARAGKRGQAIQASVSEEVAKQLAAKDALKDKVEELKSDNEELSRQFQSALASVAAHDAALKQAVANGYVIPEGRHVVQEFAFNGRFNFGGDSTFNSGEDGSNPDPDVHVTVWSDHTWTFENVDHPYSSLPMSDKEVLIGLTSAPCSSMSMRMRNVYAGLLQSKDIREENQSLSPEELIARHMTYQLKAFLLTGSLKPVAKVRWMNDCAEYLFNKYVVLEIPPDLMDRLNSDEGGRVYFSDNTTKEQARAVRDSRRAPIDLEGVNPHAPDKGVKTNIACGIGKRLKPLLPHRTDEARVELGHISTQLAQYIDAHSSANDVTFRELVAKCMEGRPQHERAGIQVGIDRWEADPNEATDYYLSKPYKCFVKMELYPEGTFKPPRFIMSMDFDCRGIQIAAMARILHRIEIGTRICNVKGLTADEITRKLEEKFQTADLVAETDFSSFESCIDPDMKNAVENNIYYYLSGGDSVVHNFIDKALRRPTVNVLGPGFNIPQFHHIRMSGDLWTSLGNLVTNICIITFVSGKPLEWVLEHGLFEGDDGVFPAPSDAAALIYRSVCAGVKLTFDIAPWQALSFCGNNFHYNEDGQLLRYRDPVKALCNSIVLFNPPVGTNRYDLMLQRSKILSGLDGPIIPDAFVFWAVIERYTRNVAINTRFLEANGYLKPWTGFGVEGCVPQWLVYKDPLDHTKGFLKTKKFIKRVYIRNRAAGGSCDLAIIKKMCDIMENSVVIPGCHITLPCPIPNMTGVGCAAARDGLRFTHRERKALMDYPGWQATLATQPFAINVVNDKQHRSDPNPPMVRWDERKRPYEVHRGFDGNPEMYYLPKSDKLKWYKVLRNWFIFIGLALFLTISGCLINQSMVNRLHGGLNITSSEPFSNTSSDSYFTHVMNIVRRVTSSGAFEDFSAFKLNFNQTLSLPDWVTSDGWLAVVFVVAYGIAEFHWIRRQPKKQRWIARVVIFCWFTMFITGAIIGGLHEESSLSVHRF